MNHVRFVLPSSWSTLAQCDLSGLVCTADTVGQALVWLTQQYPMLAQRIFADDGTIAPWVLVCLNNERIENTDTPVPDRDSELQIIAALMGG